MKTLSNYTLLRWKAFILDDIDNDGLVTKQRKNGTGSIGSSKENIFGGGSRVFPCLPTQL